MIGDSEEIARPPIVTLRNRRLIRWTLVVLAVEIVLSMIAYGWDMSSGLTTADEWETDEWLSAVGSVWILPMTILIVRTYLLYRRSAATFEEMRTEISTRRAADAAATQRLDQLRSEVSEIIDTGAITPHFQPIIRLDRTDEIVGFEALARFPTGTPHSWFSAASDAGLTIELELEALRRALDAGRALDERCYLSVNASPATIDTSEFFALFRDVDGERIVVEVTEHLAVDDYDRMNRILASLRRLGVRLAVDDAGAGFASLQHIVQLGPDIIKLDRSLVDRVHLDPSKRALARAMTSFAMEVGATVVAEGVEQRAEGVVLLDLGVQYAQGYAFGRPSPAATWTDPSSQA